MDSVLGDNGQESTIRRGEDLLNVAINRYSQNLRVINQKYSGPLNPLARPASTYSVRQHLFVLLVLGLPFGVCSCAFLLPGLLLPLILQSREVGPANLIVDDGKDFVAALSDRSCRSAGGRRPGSFLNALRWARHLGAGEEACTG